MLVGQAEQQQCAHLDFYKAPRPLLGDQCIPRLPALLLTAVLNAFAIALLGNPTNFVLLLIRPAASGADSNRAEEKVCCKRGLPTRPLTPFPALALPAFLRGPRRFDVV